jgi:hypothetical protein
MKYTRLLMALCLFISTGIRAQHAMSKTNKPDFVQHVSMPLSMFPSPSLAGKTAGISIKMKEATLSEIINVMEARAKNLYTFFRADEIKKLTGKKTIHEENISIPDLLIKLEGWFPIVTTIINNTVVIRMRPLPAGVPAAGELPARITNYQQVTVLAPVTFYYTGYRAIQKERATFAYSDVPVNQAKQNAGINIMESLTGQVPDFGGGSTEPGPLRGSLRGPNTINGNRQSAVVVDNFLFPLNTDFINLDDIDSVTMMRDAAAGVEWGSFGSNGVLVFNTKKGRYKDGFDLSITSKLSILRKPDVYYQAGPDAADYINIEKAIFDSTGMVGASGLSPVQSILQKMKNGQLGQTEGQRLLDELALQNTLADAKKYLYQPAIYQHYHLNITAGKPNFNLYASLGVDRNRFVEKGNTLGRITSRINFSYKYRRLEMTVNTLYAGIDTRSDFVKLPSRLPYLALKDFSGRDASIPYNYSEALLSGLSPNAFLNWQYYPLHELRLADNLLKERLYQFGGKIGYRFFRNFQANFFYQHALSLYDLAVHRSAESFYTRDLINLFRQNDQGIISWPIPIGSILDQKEARTTLNNIRGQLDYTFNNASFDVKVFGGFERRKQGMHIHTHRLYGADIGFPQNKIEYNKLFKLSINPSGRYIPYFNNETDSANHAQSYYAHGSVTYKKKYTFTAGGRADQTNLFAQASNQRLVPLWSAGVAWLLGDEGFYRPVKNWLDLSTRLSYGVSGNIDYTAVPFATVDAQTTNSNGVVFTMNNPANKGLTYERVFMLNAGIDFKIRQGLISGSIDYYRKRATDLLQAVSWNPTSGFTVIKNNSGGIRGRGLDINLQTGNIKLTRDLLLQASLLYAHATHVITSTQLTDRTAHAKTNDLTALPRQGYPVNALFALPFASLDPQSGAPRGFVDGKPSQAYEQLLADTSDAAVVYVGPADPTSFGSLVNTISYKKFSVSCMLIAKWGYYMRKQALSYYAMYNRQEGNTPDYYKRWQQPGDEQFTEIPSQPARPNEQQDLFFARSKANVIKADHLRLQYIQLGYVLQNKTAGKWPLKEMQVHLSVQNIGILWRANKDQVDPDVRINCLPQPITATLSVQAGF